MKGDFVPKCVTIRKDQEDFLLNEKKTFRLSKFLQSKLDEYMSALKEYRIYMEVENDE